MQAQAFTQIGPLLPEFITTTITSARSELQNIATVQLILKFLKPWW